MNKPEQPTLYLIDGSSYFYRAYHALPPLTTRAGEPTGALLGAANMVRRLLNDAHPEYVAAVFDARGKNFRHRLYPAYKAHRPPMPDDLAAQYPPLVELLDALGVPLLQVPDVEADDVIATLARKATAAGWRCVISASDKDLAQLVDDRVLLIDTMSDRRYDNAGVRQRFGVEPEQIGDYLALVGDASDNIPGVPGIGPKTAAKLLGEYHDLDRLLASRPALGDKLAAKLAAAEHLALSRQLVRLRDDLDLDVAPADLKRQPEKTAELRALLERLEFRQWLAEMAEPGTADPAARRGQAESGAPHYRAIRDRRAFAALLADLERQAAIVFDLETTSLNVLDAEIVGIALAWEPGIGIYLPLAHEGPGAEPQLDRDEVLALLKPIFESEKPAKIGQNLKYDLNVLHRAGIRLAGIADDTMLESYVLNSTATRHDMDALARHYLHRRTITYEEVAGKGARQIPFAQVAVERATEYAGEDAEVTYALHHHLAPKLAALPGPARIYHDIEMPLLPVLAAMERCGVLVDRDRLLTYSRELEKRLYALEQQAYEVAGGPFNLSSPKQLGEVLFGRLKLEVIAKTPGGQPATGEEVLEELAGRHPLPGLLLEHRALAKLKNTYTDRLVAEIHPGTGRVHTSFHQAVAATGRLSSSQPNLQNIPARTEEGRRIRKAFIAPPGKRLLALDYSQIELRIMAHLSGDEGLLAAFHSGADIHRATAAEVFGMAPERVSGEQRRAAKAINFGLLYGMSAFGLARQLGIEQSAAKVWMETYFERYPGVRRYMERLRREARDRGYVETLFGRRLWLSEIASRNPARRQAAERAAVNAPMQGTAADIIKRAMLATAGWLAESGADAALVLQVHDELVLEVARRDLPAVRDKVAALMRSAADLAVPLEVEAGDGADWEAAH